MRAINMSEAAEEGFAELMAKGLNEAAGRHKSQLTCLELLALTATRMLVSAGGVNMARLADRAVTMLAEKDSVTPGTLTAARANLILAYDNEEDLATVGITFHTFQ